MDSGYYAAVAGLVARTQALDTAAANLANAKTPGYRAEREYFRSFVLGPDGENSQVGQALNRYGVLGGDRLSTNQGALETTGNPLDLAIVGTGFFAIRTEHGVRYTRDGSFHRSQAGMLVTEQNEPVLSSANQPIFMPAGAVSVGADGVVSIGGGAVGSVGVFQFSSEAPLVAEGTNRYRAPSGATPSATRDAAVRQGALEGANLDVVQGTLDLMVMQRQAETMQKALSVFHSEFNKTAAEELPKI